MSTDAHGNVDHATLESDSSEMRVGGAEQSTDAIALARMRELLSRPLTDAHLKENTALVAAPTEARASSLLSLLIFRVGHERLAIAADDAHRVTPCSTIRRVPHRSNQVIAGIANIGGELIPVGHIGATLGITAGNAPTHFVVIGSPNSRWAFSIDELEGVVRVERSSLDAAPTTVRHAMDGCAQHVVQVAYHGVAASAPTAAAATARSLDVRRTLVTILETERLAALFAGGLT